MFVLMFFFSFYLLFLGVGGWESVFILEKKKEKRKLPEAHRLTKCTKSIKI